MTRIGPPSPSRVSASTVVRRLFDTLLIVLVVGLIWRTFTSPSSPASPPLADPLQPGTVLQLPGVRWSEASTHVVLLAETTCPACNAGLPFYRALAADVARAPSTRFIVVGRQPVGEMTQWLEASGLRPHQVVQVEQPASVGLYYAPSLYFVDSRGGVTDVLMRRLTPEQEMMVRARIGGGTGPALNNAEAYRTIGDRELQEIIARGGRLIDIREREQFRQGSTPAAANVPFDELRDRALLELVTGAPTVIDCTVGTIPRCHQAAETLRRLDFPEVVLYRNAGNAR